MRGQIKKLGAMCEFMFCLSQGPFWDFSVETGEGLDCCKEATLGIDFIVDCASDWARSRKNCSFMCLGIYSFPFFLIIIIFSFFFGVRTIFGWPTGRGVIFCWGVVNWTPTLDGWFGRLGFVGGFLGGTGSGAIIRFGFPLFDTQLGRLCTWSFFWKPFPFTRGFFESGLFQGNSISSYRGAPHFADVFETPFGGQITKKDG